ncbi:MAG: hypothetical protein HRU36_05450 [Rickettsiales bacterium]|nr:hypothetical protein [Rickettsiales bacterium]
MHLLINILGAIVSITLVICSRLFYFLGVLLFTGYMNKLRYFKKALKSLTLCVVISTTLFGCAGKSPNPVMVMQYGDESKSCDALKYEMHSMQNNMRAVLPKTEKNR